MQPNQTLTEDNISDNEYSYNLVTNREAKKFIDGLRSYFIQKGNEGSPISALNICAEFVQKQSFKNRK